MPAIHMTELWCRQVKQAAKQRDYYDLWKPVPGKSGKLAMRIGNAGTKTWVLLYYINNQKKRYTLGYYPTIKLSDARILAAQKLTDIINGLDPAIQRQEEISAPSFGYIAEIYMKHHAQKRKKTKSIEEDDRMIRKDLLPAWGIRKAKDIKKRDVIAVLDTIVDRGAPIVANRTLTLASKIFNVAIDRDLLEINPCYRIPPPGQERQRDRVLQEDELKVIWKSFDTLQPIMGALFKLRTLTAQRGAEIAAMRWKDIDMQTGWWTIPQEFTKNKLSHRVPMTDQAMAILVDLKELSPVTDWCFPSPTSKVGHIYNVQKAAKQVRERSGINDFKPHDLRRTAASIMTGMGIPRLVVSKILNHVETGITAVYDRHSYDIEKKGALTKWGQKLLKIVTLDNNGTQQPS